MFFGSTNISLDSKGRFSIPAKYRAELTQLVVVPNPIAEERCLLVYPISEWKKVEAEIVAKPNTQAIRKLKRLFLGRAVDYIIDDSHGRVLLGKNLREFAELDKKLVLVGQGNKLELWDEQAWNALQDDADDMLAELETIAF